MRFFQACAAHAHGSAPRVARRLRPGLAALGCAVLLAGGGMAPSAMAEDNSLVMKNLREAYRHCRSMEEADERLRCYDRLRDKLEPARFSGKLMATTPSFTVEAGTVIRFQSDGPIFVMYLLDAKGAIAQNLHIGGGGESTYTIPKAGSYTLQISATDGWRIWVEPPA